MNATDLVARLVDVHGEDGLAHSADEWRSILSRDGPLNVLNLLKFRSVATVEGRVASGEDAYWAYARQNTSAFQRADAESLLLRRVHLSTALGVHENWDAVVLSRYPSAESLARMWLDSDYLAASKLRERALAQSQTLFLSGRRSNGRD